MRRMNLLLVFVVLLGAGCSVAVYTPVVVGSVLGFDKKSLNDDERFEHLIGTPIVLDNADDRVWTLRRFSGGRYSILLSSPGNTSTELVFALDDRPIVITSVFEDKLNGGVYYSAEVQDNEGATIEAPKNHWYDVILDSVREVGG